MRGPEHVQKQVGQGSVGEWGFVGALDSRVTRRGVFYFGFYFYFWGFMNPSHARVRPVMVG